MKSSSRIALALALVLLLVGGFLWLSGKKEEKTPEQLIALSLADAEDAARRGSVSGVMESVSDDFQAGPWNKARLRLMLARTLGQSRGVDYEVHVNRPMIQPMPNGNPNERLVFTRFTAFYSSSGESIYNTNDGVMLLMRKETRARWLIFREPYWRIVGVPSLPSLPGGGSML